MNQVNEILRDIASFGKNEDGSYTRTCYSPEYFEAATAVEKQMKSLGMKTEWDAAGNIHGILPGTRSGAKSILIGSHMDTVPHGGLFDGAYGVASGLAVVKRLVDEGKKLEHPIEIYGFNAEESNPIGGTFGSRAVTGLVDPKQLGLGDALAVYGHTVDEIMGCQREFSDVKCYLEAHIEQGDYLDNEGLDIGVVSGIVSVIRYVVTASGQSNHAGTTMMKKRRDAMVAMAKLIVESDKACREIDDKLVLTVGTITCDPGSENVIPGRVQCIFEMRHMETEKTDELIKRIREIAAGIDMVEFTITNKINKGSVQCDSHLMDVIGQAAETCMTKHVVMPSGAGHDANPMAHKVPSAMIFVPSKGGLSHCKEEWTDPEYLEKGADVLYETVLRLDTEG